MLDESVKGACAACENVDIVVSVKIVWLSCTATCTCRFVVTEESGEEH